jgi:hypothetical protein
MIPNLGKVFFTAVRDMRQSQKEYFATRSPAALKASKEKEKVVDKYIEYLNKNGTQEQGERFNDH